MRAESGRPGCWPAVLLLWAAAGLSASCASADRIAERDLQLAPGDRLELSGAEMTIEIVNKGPGRLRVTALDGQGARLLPSWEIGVAATTLKRRDLRRLWVDNFSDRPATLDYTASAVTAEGADLRGVRLPGGAGPRVR